MQAFRICMPPTDQGAEADVTSSSRRRPREQHQRWGMIKFSSPASAASLRSVPQGGGVLPVDIPPEVACQRHISAWEGGGALMGHSERAAGDEDCQGQRKVTPQTIAIGH